MKHGLQCAFETKNLRELIAQYYDNNRDLDINYISDFTSAEGYKKLKQDPPKNDFVAHIFATVWAIYW